MSTLILFLPPVRPGPATEYSYTLTADGHTALRHATAPAALLPEPTRPGGEVVAVVPARALSWQRVQMPAGVPLGAGQQTPRLRSVLEGLLEDRLLDDATQLHFALQPGAHGTAQGGEPVWVAVCDRAWLRENLQALEAAGRRVSRVVPEFAPGPTASGGPELCALGTPEEAFVVLTGQGADQGVAVLPLTPMALALARAGTPMASATAEQDGTTLPVRAEPAVAALAERTLNQQGQRVALHTASQRALDAARGHPGLADDWLRHDGLALREAVARDLKRLEQGEIGVVETAQRWANDELADARLRHAADLALEQAGRIGLTDPARLNKLATWFDAANRTRDLLRTTVRADLAMVELLLAWAGSDRGRAVGARRG